MPDRGERSLLMAELQERGVRVAAEEQALPALRRVLLEGLGPGVILWDCKLGIPDGEIVESFRRAIPGLRFLFLRTAGCRMSEIALPSDVIERRPVAVGKLAEELIRTLHEAQDESEVTR